MKQAVLILTCLGICTFVAAQNNSTPGQNTSKLANVECPHPIFKFGNGMSRMPAVQFKQLAEARVEMSDFSNISYKLKKFTVTILHNETHTFETITNEGNVFTEKTKTFLNSLKPNDIIMVSGISAVDQTGETIYIQERNFGAY